MQTLLRLTLLITLLVCAKPAHAVIGCSLNNPDADIARFFPGMQSYRVHYLSFKNQNPNGLAALEKELQTPLDPVFETQEIPYSLYVVEGEQGALGYVFGANNRGAHSSIQVIAILNRQLKLQEIYLQRIRSPDAKVFQSPVFLEALSKIALQDFKGFSDCYRDKKCDNMPIQDPSKGRSQKDFRAILRGLAKLDLLRTHLLELGQPPSPMTNTARAEWISNYRGKELSLATALPMVAQTRAPEGWSPNKQVFVWAHQNKAFVWPVGLLATHPILSAEYEKEHLTLIKASRSGNPVILRSTQPEHFKPTLDLLFEDQVFMDLRSGSQWSMSLGESLYGPRANERVKREVGGIQLSWSQAQKTGLDLIALTHPTKTRQGQHTPPALLVISTDDSNPGFSISGLSPKKILIQKDLLIARIGDDAIAWRVSDTMNQRHEFHRDSDFLMKDVATSSTWSLISGQATEGPLKGRQLQGLELLRLQESHWRSLFPNQDLPEEAQ